MLGQQPYPSTIEYLSVVRKKDRACDYATTEQDFLSLRIHDERLKKPTLPADWPAGKLPVGDAGKSRKGTGGFVATVLTGHNGLPDPLVARTL